MPENAPNGLYAGCFLAGTLLSRGEVNETPGDGRHNQGVVPAPLHHSSSQ